MLAAGRLARVVTGSVGHTRLTWTVMAFWIAYGGLAVSIAVGGRALGGTGPGIWTALATGAVFAGWARTRWSHEAPLPTGPGARSAWVVAGLWALFYGSQTRRYQLFDEWGLLGHKAIIERLGRGELPPSWPFAPGVEARYHYGIDVLPGAVRHAFGGVWGHTADRLIDAQVTVLAAVMALTAAAVVVECGARRSAWVGAVLIHLGAGLAFVIYAFVEPPDSHCLIQYSCTPEAIPSQFANFWQKPVSIGVPAWIVGTLLLQAVLRSPRAQLLPVLASAVCVWTLAAISQVVFFGLGALAALTALPFVRRPSPGRALAIAGVLGGALALGSRAGGMFAPSELIEPDLFHLRETFGYPENQSWAQIGFFFLAYLGLPWLLFPFTAWRSLRTRRFVPVAFAAFAFGGCLACQLFVYDRSWDIVKFPSAAAFALTLLYVIFVDARLRAWPWLRRVGGLLVGGGGVLVALSFVFPWPSDHQPYPFWKMEPDPQVAAAIDWLGPRVDTGLVFAQENIARELSVLGGLPVVGFDRDLYHMGVATRLYRPFMYKMRRLQTSLDPELLREMNVRYLVFSDEEVENLGPRAQRRLEADPELVVRATFPPEPGEPERKRRRIWSVEVPAS